MVKTADTICNEIGAFINKHGGNPGQWFVAQSTDPKRELARRHGVGKVAKTPYIIRSAESELQANSVVEHFVTRYKSKGSAEEITRDALYVYAYKTTTKTKP